MRTQLILLGAPGSGKGTQASRIVAHFGYKHVSTGDLLRSEIANGTTLGKKVKSIMDAGELVGDDIVLELLKKNCNINDNSYIFDGYPRNIDQAISLDREILVNANYKALYFDIDLGVLLERIVNRRVAPRSGQIYNLISRPPLNDGVCDVSGEKLVHRKDDNEEAVRKRLDIFRSEIEPILDYYSSKNVLIKIDALKGPDEIFSLVCNIIK